MDSWVPLCHNYHHTFDPTMAKVFIISGCMYHPHALSFANRSDTKQDVLLSNTNSEMQVFVKCYRNHGVR